MKKTLAILLALAMSVSMFAGCAGTAVVEKEQENVNTEAAVETVDTEVVVETEVVAETEVDATAESTSDPIPVKTGLSITTTLEGTDATAEADGTANAEIVIVAVTVDEDGVINSCVIDAIQGENTFNANGEITTEKTEFLSKNELGEGYGMVAWGGAIAEWDAQAAAFAEYVVGMTAEEVKGIAIAEGGKAADTDLTASCTIAIAGFIDPIVKAVNNAKDLGAAHWDTLKLVSVTTPHDNANAGEKDGTASAYATVAAVTTHYDEITSCMIDAVQANVTFDATGKITTDFSKEVSTKNELGDDYNMVAWGGAIAEWYEQAASFASYITGKTISDVAGIAVDETTKPTGEDLTASVTIKIGDFMTLIEKAGK